MNPLVKRGCKMNYIERIRQKIGSDPLIKVVCGVIICVENKILLQRRTDNNLWAIHGGGMELGETTEETVKRETFEEIGIELQSLKLYGVYSGEFLHSFHESGDENYVVLIVYFCDSIKGEVAIDNSEVKDVQWFPVECIPQNINEPEKIIFQNLESFLRGCTV